MPQEFHIGHRSSLVTFMAWGLLVLGTLAVLLAWWAPQPLLATFCALWGLACAATGNALGRRLEWGRRVARTMLSSLPLLAVLVGLGWAGLQPSLTLGLGVAAMLLPLGWALRRLNSRGVRQEFA
ncbi:hypothetical protein LZ017_01610 [Pelomonas sp. CA6]|uniref:hypothetical protein n=1 Tax=Pelomonas sp. CA6 TaxID=2907999 RepID=UPI001F4AE390|nr:hypothetical protein [Pelomonas sp. CA6]MCH7342083.1 hypothetical protein [Pelomonas sp. CA6]